MTELSPTADDAMRAACSSAATRAVAACFGRTQRVGATVRSFGDASWPR